MNDHDMLISEDSEPRSGSRRFEWGRWERSGRPPPSKTDVLVRVLEIVLVEKVMQTITLVVVPNVFAQALLCCLSCRLDALLISQST